MIMRIHRLSRYGIENYIWTDYISINFKSYFVWNFKGILRNQMGENDAYEEVETSYIWTTFKSNTPVYLYQILFEIWE